MPSRNVRPWRPALLRPSRLALLAVAAVTASSCDDVNVTAVDVASLTLSPAEATVNEGDTVRLEATLRDASGNTIPGRPVSWVSEDPEVAEVADGLVRGLGTGTARIRATSGSASDEASVTVVEPPTIVLSESELHFEASAGDDPTDPHTVEISNGGEGTLGGMEISIAYSSGQPTGWLDAALEEPAAPTSISVRADPSDLPPGTYRGEVEISAPGAVNSPQVIEVAFVVGVPPPLIVIEPESVLFEITEGEGAPPPRTVSVANGGGGELTGLGTSISYGSGEPAGWLQADLAGASAPTELTLRVDPAGLQSPLVVDAVVEITAPGAPDAALNVRFRLGEPPPEIELAPDEIGWEIVENAPSPAHREVAIGNRGGGSLGGLSVSVEYASGGPTGWLGVMLTSTQAPSVLRADLTNTSLPPGEHTATLRIASPDADNSPQPVSVRVQVAPRASAATSTIEADPTSIVADGSSTSAITVRLRDARGDPMPTGGDAVSLSTTLGALSGVTDQGDGTYTATLTSSTTTGTATITGTVNGSAIADDASVELTARSPSAATSTIEASPTSIVADGESTSTITVQLRDADGNELTGGGADVTLSTTAGTLGSVSDNDDGTYTATLTASSDPGTATITGTVNGATIEDEATVELTPRSASAATSTIDASPTSIVADGESTSTITVQLRDADGSQLTSGGDDVTLSTTAGSLGSVSDNDDGTYTATLTASSDPDTATITGTVNGATIEDEATVEFTPRSSSAATSTIEASPTSIVADGGSSSTITVQLRDADGNELTHGGDAVTLSTTAGSLGSVSDHEDGTYEAILTSSTTVETATLTGTVNGAAIEDDAAVEFTPGGASPATSTIDASPSFIVADGESTALVTVQLRDGHGNEITSGGDDVTLASTAGSLGAVTDNEDGSYTATLTSSTTPETATVTGTVNGAVIDDEATVEFTGDSFSGSTGRI